LTRSLGEKAPPVGIMAVSPDNRWLALIHQANYGGAMMRRATESEIRIWDLEKGEVVRTLKMPDVDYINHLVFSRDSRELVAAAISYRDSMKVCSWNVASGNRTSEWSAANYHQYGFALAMSPDASTLAVAMSPGIIRLFDRVTGKEKTPTGAHFGSIESMAFSSKGEGDRLLTTGSDRTIKTWDCSAGKLLATVDAPGLFSPQSRLVARRRSLLYRAVSE
jgi:WD40 repeat protein